MGLDLDGLTIPQYLTTCFVVHPNKKFTITTVPTLAFHRLQNLHVDKFIRIQYNSIFLIVNIHLFLIWI